MTNYLYFPSRVYVRLYIRGTGDGDPEEAEERRLVGIFGSIGSFPDGGRAVDRKRH